MGMDKPELTIIVPHYNNASYLGQCITSVLQQTYAQYEVIIIDDASTDGSREIIEGFRKAHPDTIRTVYKQHNEGAVVWRDFAFGNGKWNFNPFETVSEFCRRVH